jgi:uncharacterized protein
MTIRVTVAIGLRKRQEVIELDLPATATVADALAAAGLEGRFPEIDFTAVHVGIWSRRCTREARLREGDRVEIYRPLEADPKQMRRARLGKAPPS